MKVDVMIAGAQKAGTSSLKYYLGQHPDISSHLNLECDYFTSNDNDFGSYCTQYFEEPANKILAKQAHLYKEESYIKKLYEHNPECKILFVLREPVERLISAYEMEKKEWVDFSTETFIEAINANNLGDYHLAYNTLVKLGDYGRAAEIIYKYFPRDQVFFISFRELKEQPLKLCKRIFQFMEVGIDYKPKISKKNVAYTHRSIVLSKLLVRLKRSSLKGIFKQLFPYRYFLYISNRIEMLNRKKASVSGKAEWDEATLSLVKKFYEKSNSQFEIITGLRSKDYF